MLLIHHHQRHRHLHNHQAFLLFNLCPDLVINQPPTQLHSHRHILLFYHQANPRFYQLVNQPFTQLLSQRRPLPLNRRVNRVKIRALSHLAILLPSLSHFLRCCLQAYHPSNLPKSPPINHPLIHQCNHRETRLVFHQPNLHYSL
jgi:hypothetical protein